MQLLARRSMKDCENEAGQWLLSGSRLEGRCSPSVPVVTVNASFEPARTWNRRIGRVEEAYDRAFRPISRATRLGNRPRKTTFFHGTCTDTLYMPSLNIDRYYNKKADISDQRAAR